MLYLIPTPIGNRNDITLRALDLFKSLDTFFCEDTRTFKSLLSMYEIEYSNKQFYAFTTFTDKSKLNFYTKLLKEKDVGVVSEAGTPGLSDPGKSLIQICNENGIQYSVLPGATALIPAVVSSGFDTSNFVYLGFLPQKKGRQTILKGIINNEGGITKGTPVFFYESVHRFEKLLSELHELGFNGKICVCREISKMYEQIYNGDLETLIDLVKNKKYSIKGEFVIGLIN